MLKKKGSMALHSFNKVFIIGNLTRDPILKVTPNGASVCTFGVATNSKYKRSDGSLIDIATYIDIVAWSKLAEICAQKLKKGMKVFLEGELRTRNLPADLSGENKGIKNKKVEVRIVDMKIIDDRSKARSSTSANSNVVDNPDSGTDMINDSNLES